MVSTSKMARSKLLLLLAMFFSLVLVITFLPQEGLAAGETAELKVFENKEQDPQDITDQLTEKLVNEEGFKIEITLTTVNWAPDLAGDHANEFKQKALINAFTAGTEQEQWEKVQKKVVEDSLNFDINGQKLTITIPKTAGYFITEDQVITLKIPSQMLADSENIDPLTLTIKADPKAIISGAEFTETELVTGGQKIVITLINAKWDPKVVTNTTTRNSLIDHLCATGTEDDDVEQWERALSVIKATGNVTVSENEKIMTITLPSVPGFNIKERLKVNSKNLDNNNFFQEFQEGGSISTFGEFSIVPLTNQTAVISGDVLSATTDYDIANGGKTIIVTLRNDNWVENIDKNKVLDGFMVSPLDKENDKKQWEDFIEAAKSEIKVERRSDKEIMITLPPKSDFKLANDITVQLTVKPELLSTANEVLTASPVFKISAVVAELSGTALQPLDAADIKKGGKSIIITLSNATWADSEDFNNHLIGGFSSNLESNPWDKVKETLKTNPNCIKRSKNRVTITLPPVTTYNLEGDGEEVTLAIPSGLINGAPAELDAIGTIKIGQVASAILSPAQLSENEILNGEAEITIRLSNNKWVANLPDNVNVKNALIKSFSVQDQNKEWDLVKQALQKSTMTLDDACETLTITCPPVPEYSICREQKVMVTIPKTALENSKSSLIAGELVIKVPDCDATETLMEIMERGLPEHIKNHYLEKIRVVVPEKYVHTININTIEVPGKNSQNDRITTVEILTDSAVNSVEVSVKSQVQELSGSNRFIFVFQNLEKDSEMTIRANGSDGQPLQSEIYKKIGKGSKSYNELPKKELNGSYALYRLLTDKSLFKDILKYYSVNDLKIGVWN